MEIEERDLTEHTMNHKMRKESLKETINSKSHSITEGGISSGKYQSMTSTSKGRYHRIIFVVQAGSRHSDSKPMIMKLEHVNETKDG
jgi:hypothetical protein